MSVSARDSPPFDLAGPGAAGKQRPPIPAPTSMPGRRYVASVATGRQAGAFGLGRLAIGDNTCGTNTAPEDWPPCPLEPKLETR